MQWGSASLGLVVVALGGCTQLLGLEAPDRDQRDGGVDASVMHDGYCDPGYQLTADGCVDIDECATGTDTCSANATCTNVAGSFMCACKPGYDGNGMTCMKRCNSALVYVDCPTSSLTSCTSINESMFITNAVTGRGLTVTVATDNAAFKTDYDAGGFDLLIIDAGRTDITADTASRAALWASADKLAIVSYWNLDNNTTGQTMRTALGVDVTSSFTTPKDAYYDPAGGVNLFSRVEQVASPITFSDTFMQDGNTLALTGAGRIVARFGSATGGGAAAITHGDKVITLGFLPTEATQDDNANGKSDAQELYTNMISYLCGN